MFVAAARLGRGLPALARRLSSKLSPSTQKLVDSLQTVELNNGLSMRYADTAPGDATRPLVVFMHGWPESWFSWRHQLAAVHEAGYRCVAPDMRGYGGTDAPAATEDYSVAKRTGDMKALLDHLGAGEAAFVGHDHGAFTGWFLAQLRPEIVSCYMALSVPLRAKRAPVAPLWFARKAKYGDEALPKSVYGWGHLFPWAPRPPQSFSAWHDGSRLSSVQIAPGSRRANESIPS